MSRIPAHVPPLSPFLASSRNGHSISVAIDISHPSTRQRQPRLFSFPTDLGFSDSLLASSPARHLRAGSSPYRPNSQSFLLSTRSPAPGSTRCSLPPDPNHTSSEPDLLCLLPIEVYHQTAFVFFPSSPSSPSVTVRVTANTHLTAQHSRKPPRFPVPAPFI